MSAVSHEQFALLQLLQDMRESSDATSLYDVVADMDAAA